MKVLLTATVQSHICQFHRPLAEVLHEHGCEVHAAARNNLAEKNGLKLDFVEKVFDIPFSRSPKSPDNIKAYRELKKIINEGQYDVVHCNTPMGGIVTRLAARKARKKGTKVYYTAHGFHFYKGAPKKNWLIFYPVEKIFSRMTDKLITITKEDYKLASRKFPCEVCHMHGVGVDKNRYHSISENEQLELRQKLGFFSEEKIILCVGELLPNKNQQMAVYAMNDIVKKYPDSRLLIAGNGKEKDNLEKLIKDRKLEPFVTMLGYVTNLQEYQKIADICISCSKREGLPLNIVEAMLTRTPVVASENRGHRELIRDGATGLLVKADDYKAMADKIKSLIENPKMYRTMQDKGEHYIQKYTFENVKKELNKVYEFKDE